MTKQKKTDFKPKNDEISAMGINTEPCQACCTAMGKLLESAKENLSGMNQEIFLTDIAVTFHACVTMVLTPSWLTFNAQSAS